MALSRCSETRLLEAVLVETIACFTDALRAAAGQAEIGLNALYYSNGYPRIYARPFRNQEALSPYMIQMMSLPPTWYPNTSGGGETLYEIEINFIFPFDLANVVPGAGANSFLDHITVYRTWLISGGTSPSMDRSLIDPDAAGDISKRIGVLRKFAQEDFLVAANNAGIMVPVILGYEIREKDSTGEPL